MTSVRVIGCGNPDAGDDAAGLLAVRRARPAIEGIEGVQIVEAGSALRVLDLLEGADAVVVVDAVRSAAGARPPGQLVRAEADSTGLRAELGPALSSHGFGLADAIAVAAAMDRSPRLIFVGVEAGDVAAGHPLSPAVREAVPRLAELIEQEVRFLAEGEPTPGGGPR